MVVVAVPAWCEVRRSGIVKGGVNGLLKKPGWT